jgi:hypothetical protein
MIRRILLVVGALTTLGAERGSAWETIINGTQPFARDEPASGVVVDAAGAIFVSGGTENAGSGRNFTLAKLDGTTGTELWRYVVTSAEGSAIGVATDGTDVAAAGSVGSDWTAAKVDGTSGAELWRVSVSDATVLGGIGFDPAGDIIVTGGNGAFPSFEIFAVKLDGSDGSELWRYERTAIRTTTALTVDAAGDVILLGDGYTLVKVAGGTGSEAWTRVVDPPADLSGPIGHALATDSAGDVIAVGAVNNEGANRPDFAVVKLASATGAELWRREVDGSAIGSDDEAFAVAVDAADDVVAVGIIEDDAAVVKLAGASGAELWRSGPLAEARAVAIDGAGNVFATVRDVFASASDPAQIAKYVGTSGLEVWRGRGSGELVVDPAGTPDAAFTALHRRTSLDVTVTELSGRLSGKSLTAKSSGGAAIDRLTLNSLDPTTMIPSVDGPADPVLHGATVEIVNPVTMESASLFLPALFWERNSTGLRYSDPQRAASPCRKVTLKRERQLKVSCGGAGIGFTLDEAAQGTLAVRLTLGNGPLAVRLCSRFGGTIKRDVPGFFQARDAPTPVACP